MHDPYHPQPPPRSLRLHPLHRPRPLPHHHWQPYHVYAASWSNHYGQLGDGTNTYKSTPIQVTVGQLASSHQCMWLCTAASDSVFLTASADTASANTFSTRRNDYGQLGDSNNIDNSTPGRVNQWLASS
mmetsp:Transcript_17003/g.20485  ORF Transcript_17003/g.20485 Transcript_17003/m.20485 type:complete len:129 (-) Transcript_17003:585-971(-)